MSDYQENVTQPSHLTTNMLKMTALSPPSHKVFYPPGTIEELEEELDGYDDRIKKLDSSAPLLYPSPQFVSPTIVNLNRVHTSPSLGRDSAKDSLTKDSFTRVSTCNSSLFYSPSSIRYDGSKRSFRLNAARKMRRRAIFKNGDCNILQSRISKRRLRYLQDIFTTLVDSQWRWTLTIFALAFLGSWLIFALFWWLIAYSHDDLSEEHLPTHQADSNWTPCVLNIYGFTSCFLFSIETQHTIGYGVRTTTEECPEAIFVMCFQSIVGMIIQAFMCGIVFAKMTRPKLRTQTLQFSKNAVICQREGYLSLMFRVGDMRKSHIIGASIRAQLICSKKTKEGEVLNNFQTELTVNADGCDGNLFFIWPMTIVHRIDEDSPFYQLSAADMLQDRFEIVVILEGTIESTGQTTQARSSYLATEVLWGHRFEPVVSYNKDRQGYEVNYSKFDNTVTIDTPLCSAADLAAFYKAQEIQEQRSESDKDFPEETNPQSSSYFYLEPAPQGKPKNAGLSPPEIFENHAKEEQICQTFEFPEPITPFENNFNFPKRTARRGSLPGFVRSASQYDCMEKTYYDVPEEEDEDYTKLRESQHWRI